MIYKMSKPSENMLKPFSEIMQMYREYDAKIAEADGQKQALAESAQDREYAECMAEQSNRMLDEARIASNRSNKLASFKNALMVECFMKIFKESAVGPMTKQDKLIARNLVTNFVKENGVGNLLIDFRTKNVVLSEFARLVNKYYDRAVTEGCCNEGEEDRPAIGLEVKECDFNQTLVDDFFKDLEDVDTEVVSKMVNARVSDAINQFIDDNAAAKMEYEDIIQSAKDKVESNKVTEEAAISIMNIAKQEINEIKQNRPCSVFHMLVKSLTESVLKDENLKARYVHEAKVDMDNVVNSSALIYTMLEICNTTGAVNVTETYLNDYIASLTA